MADRDKVTQIYEIVSDMTLKAVKSAQETNGCYLDDLELDMIRTTQSLYECINAYPGAYISTVSTADTEKEPVDQ